MYDPTRLKFIPWHLQCNKWTESKINLLLLIDVSNPIWYPERSDSKRSSITSCALSHTMTSMLSLFKCIKHSSSICLEETKLVAIGNWTFDVSGSWRSFIISF